MRRTKQSSSKQSKSNKRQTKRRAVKPAGQAICAKPIDRFPSGTGLTRHGLPPIYHYATTGMKSHEILPPIFRPAGGARHLVRDSVCGNTAVRRRQPRVPCDRGKECPQAGIRPLFRQRPPHRPPTSAKPFYFNYSFSLVQSSSSQAGQLGAVGSWLLAAISGEGLGYLEKQEKTPPSFARPMQITKLPRIHGVPSRTMYVSNSSTARSASTLNNWCLKGLRLNAHYLLPCSCGEKIPVEPRQAGQAVQCACGNSVTVPTLLEMAKLERAEAIAVPEAQRHPPLWGISQRLVVLGAVIILLGGSDGGVGRPHAPGAAAPRLHPRTGPAMACDCLPGGVSTPSAGRARTGHRRSG